MKNSTFISLMEQMTQFEKLDYWLDYMIRNVALRNNFIIWTGEPGKNWNENDFFQKESKLTDHRILTLHLWKDLRIMSFEAYCESNAAPGLKHDIMVKTER